MTRVCFVQHASEWPQIEGIARYLKDRNVEFVFVCKTRREYERYKEHGFESFFISEIFNDNRKFSDKELKKIEDMYGPPGLQEIGSSDVHLLSFYRSSVSERNQLIARALKYWELFYAKHNIDYVIAREAASFSERTSYLVAHSMGLPFVQFHNVSPSYKHFILADVEDKHLWSEMFDVINKGLKKLSSMDEQFVLNFVDSRITGGNKGVPLRINSDSFLTVLKKLFGMRLRDTQNMRRSDPIRGAALRFGFSVLFKQLKWRYITQRFFKYDKPKKERYVYFPLYTGLEASYMSMDHYWAYNQISLIREVANSLPSGYRLYVKEHPTNPGYLTYFQLKEVQNISNVCVLHPTISSQDIDLHSDAVVVMQGTAGWEAFLKKKPVICLSTPFYYASDLIYKVNVTQELSTVLWEAIHKGSSIYEEREDEWLWFIWVLLITCYQGEIVNPKPPFGFKSDDATVEKLAEAIYKKIRKDLVKST